MKAPAPVRPKRVLRSEHGSWLNCTPNSGPLSRPPRRRPRREMLLDDHAGGAGRERVAGARQIGAGDRLGDRAGVAARHVEPLDVGCRRSAPAATAQSSGRRSWRRRASTLPTRSITAIIAGQAARLRFGDGLGDDLLDVGDG